MSEKFKTSFFVKSSLISLYLALTIPIPFISNENLKLFSIFAFVLGLFCIFNLTNDYVNTCEKKISYKTSFISKLFGKKDWVIQWNDIKLIKSLPTSQRGKIYFFITNKDRSFIMPQRIENFKRFLSIVENKTKLDVGEVSYISPLWTYKLLTLLSILMILGEVLAFVFKYYQY